jgi:hypothetical protein
MTAAGAGQARHLLFHIAQRHAEKAGDVGIHLRRIDRALGRDDVTRHHLLGEVAAPGRTAGAAVGFRQHILDLADARVFVDIQTLVGQRQHPGQSAAQDRHEGPRHRHACQASPSTLPLF